MTCSSPITSDQPVLNMYPRNSLFGLLARQRYSPHIFEAHITVPTEGTPLTEQRSLSREDDVSSSSSLSDILDEAISLATQLEEERHRRRPCEQAGTSMSTYSEEAHLADKEEVEEEEKATLQQ